MRKPVLAGLLATAMLAPVPDVNADTRAAGAEVAAYLDQTLVWQPCSLPGPDGRVEPDDRLAGLECSAYRVPRDWNDPQAGVDVSIAVSRLRPPGGGARTIFTNPGGPGGEGRSLPRAFAEGAGPRLLAQSEIVGMDTRGVGGSTNVTCDLQSETGAYLDVRDRRPENARLLVDAVEYLARACQAATDLGPFVTTFQMAHDIDLLRALMGLEQIDWVGYSAGTWLGAFYARLFPTRVGRFVLDSVVDSTGTWQDIYAADAAGFQRRYDVDFLPWVASQDLLVGLGATPPDVGALVERIREHLARSPMRIDDGYDHDDDITTSGFFHAADLDAVLAVAMYAKDYFEPAAELLASLAGEVEEPGTLTPAQQQDLATAAAAARRRSPGSGAVARSAETYEDDFAATLFSVVCNDTPWVGDRESITADAERIGPIYPLVGWYQAQPCPFWRRPAVELPAIGGAQLPPMLLVNSERDPATPIEGAVRVAQALGNSPLLRVEDEGDHGMYLTGNRCVDETVEAFLVNGELPGSGAICAGQPIPPALPGGAGTMLFLPEVLRILTA